MTIFYSKQNKTLVYKLKKNQIFLYCIQFEFYVIKVKQNLVPIVNRTFIILRLIASTNDIVAYEKIDAVQCMTYSNKNHSVAS